MLRRYSARPLPDAPRYLPGRAAHPGPGVGIEKSGPLDPAAWETCDDYLYGIDLFNAGYWWEAHEIFETFWRAAGRDTPLGRFFQGLIQIAAALLKHAVGSMDAARSLARSGNARLRESSGIFLGIDRAELTLSVESFLSGENETVPRIHLQTHRNA